jgi:hypothetical protein
MIMEATYKVFDSLKVVIPGPNPFLVRVCNCILSSSIQKFDDILLSIYASEFLIS